MSQYRGSPLADPPHRVSEQPADLKAGFRQWRAGLHQNPSLPWRTTWLRASVWVVLGLCALLVACVSTNSLAPAANGQVAEQSIELAAIRVAYTSPDYGGSYTRQQPMDFDTWRFTCRKRVGRDGYQGKLRSECRNRFAKAPGNADGCPFYAWRECEGTTEPPPECSISPDDAEEPR